jgi:hypothetical protein
MKYNLVAFKVRGLILTNLNREGLHEKHAVRTLNLGTIPSHPISLRSILILSTQLRNVRWVAYLLRLRMEDSCEYILNKQSRTADKEWASSLWFRRGDNNSLPKKI